MQLTIDDYRWLTSDDARPWLERSEGSHRVEPARIQHLRQFLTEAQTHLVLQQIDLRDRALQKFRRAEELFFTPKGLEQATGEPISIYKSRLFPKDARLADLCCGIGGDLMELGRDREIHGYDLDVPTAWLAKANAGRCGLPHCQIETIAAECVDISEFDGWHIDPDRRPRGHRTSQVALGNPNEQCLERMLDVVPHALMKLAPAAEIPNHWSQHGQREWIGWRRECRQQLVRFGKLAALPAQHTATVLLDLEANAATVSGPPGPPRETAPAVGRYVWEPHATVLAADLTGVLAEHLSARAVAWGIGYLTADQPQAHPLAAMFETLEVVPLDLRKIKSLARKRNYKISEVKKRGTEHDPADVLRRLRGTGSDEVTLLLTKSASGAMGIFARRIAAES